MEFPFGCWETFPPAAPIPLKLIYLALAELTREFLATFEQISLSLRYGCWDRSEYLLFASANPLLNCYIYPILDVVFIIATFIVTFASNKDVNIPTMEFATNCYNLRP